MRRKLRFPPFPAEYAGKDGAPTRYPCCRINKCYGVSKTKKTVYLASYLD